MNTLAKVPIHSTKRWLILANVLFWILLAALLSYVIYATNQVEGRSWSSLFAQGLFGIVLLMVPPVYFNTQVLIPQLLTKRHYFYYAGSLLLTSLIWPPFPIYLDNLIDTHFFNARPEDLDEPFDIIGTFVTLFVLVISTLVNMTFRSFRQQGRADRAEKEKLALELSMLRNQISPHFFFNTLNNLYALALEKSKETPDMILKLSELMRYTLYDCDGPAVKVTDEIRYLENYIDLQLIRHKQKVDVSFEKQVEDKELVVCPLVLIVFLENAFKHGVEGLEEGAYVKIGLTASDKSLVFVIENRIAPARSLNAEPGIGLQNARKRLQLVYGSNFVLETTAKQDIYSVYLKVGLK